VGDALVEHVGPAITVIAAITAAISTSTMLRVSLAVSSGVSSTKCSIEVM